MDIVAIRLVLVTTKPGLIVMCQYPNMVVAFFECMRIDSTFLDRDSLPFVMIYKQIT